MQLLRLVKDGGKAHRLLDFLSFVEADAKKLTLRCMRLLIAEAEIAKLKIKHGLTADMRK